MKKKSKIMISIIGGLLFVIVLLAVKFIDVDQIGPQGTSIGLSHINKAVFDKFGVNMVWYEVTDCLGIVAILVAFIFALIGFVQLIQRRSLLKVDREIFILGALYTVVIGLYVLFEFVIVNYRPIIMPDSNDIEASFPSSHTMLVITVMTSAIIAMDKYVDNRNLTILLKAICVCIILVTVVGRLICGVHWLTDILAAIFISTALLPIFSTLFDI